MGSGLSDNVSVAQESGVRTRKSHSPGEDAAVQVIANYLPQFHPIPENDKWWGTGFTEWTNVAKAKPLFPGHYQPQLPADLGFYDLRVPEVREAQAKLAREHGVSAFCYWHYWFAGQQLLQRPFQEVLQSGQPDFPFCLGWANHTWSGLWSGGDEKHIIKEQTYPGREDHKRHFEFLLTAFRDPRYVRVAGKPLFVIYQPLSLPDCREALDFWRDLAGRSGLDGLHFVATLEYDQRNWDARAHGFDAVTVWPLGQVFQSGCPIFRTRRTRRWLKERGYHGLAALSERNWPALDWVYDYRELRPLLICKDRFDLSYYPMAIPNWDTTARYGARAVIFHESTPAAFALHLRDVLGQAMAQPVGNRIVFIKSWNEWAEGNYLEPDMRFGLGYLEALKDELISAKRQSIRSVHEAHS